MLLDYTCWFTPCFRLKPFAGIRADWTSINFTVDAFDTGTFGAVPNTITDIVKFTNKHWGVGLLAGMKPEWFFSRCFGVHGLFDFSLLWGQFNGKRKEDYTLTGGLSATTFQTLITRSAFHGMKGALDLGLGLFYTTTLCCNRYRLISELSWEHHIWYNFVNRVQFNPEDFFPDTGGLDRYFNKTDEFTSDLIFGGISYKLQFYY